MKTPFIKKFKTKHAYYIYDVNSSELIESGRLVYDLIDDIGSGDSDVIVNKWKHRYSKIDIQTAMKDIEIAKRDHKLFSDHRPAIFSGYRSAEDIKKSVEHNVFQLILEVTSRCNLRCKYCTFSGRYSNFRGHGDEKLSLEMALKAVEYFIGQGKNKSETEPQAISFYGGEPCLRFDLIKEVAAFIKSKGVLKKTTFGITSNGTLLTDEMIEFFAENNFNLTLSLDGPRKINDRYRAFADGEGTFDIILTNLEKIKKNYPAYFKQKVSINPVISPPYPFETLIDFFSEEPVFESLRDRISISFVNDHETTFFGDFGLEKEREKMFVEMKKLRQIYKHALIQGNYDQLTLEKSIFLDDFHTIARRTYRPLQDTFPPIGTCVPGKRRIFVDTKGKFYMCERVGDNYQIGDVDNGLDFNRIFDFFTAYDEFFKDCGNCWALRLCKKCFNHVRKGDQFDEDTKKIFCKVKLHNLEENLITYCEILEENPDAFDVYKDVVMK